MISSWSCPNVFCPFSASTPITLNGILLKRIVLPIGSSPFLNIFSTTVCPITTTLVAASTSWSVNILPSFIDSLRIFRYSGLTPCIEIGQLLFAKITWPLPFTCGDISVSVVFFSFSAL